MKRESNKALRAGIRAKYMRGEMDEAESSAFKAAISLAPDTRRAWTKLHQRLQDENLIPEQPRAGTRVFMQPLVRIAAAVLIVAGIGAVVYLTMKRQPAADLVQLNTGNEANTLVKTLEDGSVIYIAQNSRFSYPEEFLSGSRNVELKGEAFFDIAPNPGKPFIIETSDAVIRVLGTAFNVNTQNGKSFELVVDRGSVKVSLKADPSYSETVVAGEKVSVVENSLVKSKPFASGESAWYKQRMHFKDETLAHIILVLNRNFNTTFVLSDREIGKHRLTVTFDHETAETMKELICVTLNLKSQTIDGNVVLFENREGAKQH